MNDSAASDAVRRRLAPKGGIIIISKRNDPAFRRREGRTDRAKGILKTLEAVKARGDKVEELERAGMRKLPMNIIKRIKFGKWLIRKRKNKEKWDYNPVKEPDDNVDLYFDEENDEDVDENEAEYWYDENEEHDGWGPWFMCVGFDYRPFNASNRRFYYVNLKKSVREYVELREWLQRAINGITPGSDVRYRQGNLCGVIVAHMSEKEADAIAGLDDVRSVTPAEG